MESLFSNKGSVLAYARTTPARYALSLYGKYRPQNFANLVGQDHIRETLLHEIERGTLTHAYLFTGPRGTGKTSTARLIAKALNCTARKPQGDPCEECDFCKTITEGSLIDVIEIDAASNRGIDEIRELKEKIQFAPTRAKTKTYIIDEVHMLTKEAFNALLKTLEEPPENVYFILCTTEVHKIPETIISRCQRFDFKRIEVRTIMTRLNYIAQMEGVEVEDSAIELIARHVEGGLRDAIGLLEQMTIENRLRADHVRSHLGITGHETITQLIDLLEKKEVPKALHLVNAVHNEGYDLTSFVREISECLRERLITGIQQNQGDHTLWLGMIMHFEEARDMLRSTVIPQLPLEIAVIKICGTTASASADAAITQSGEPAKVKEKKEKTVERPETLISTPEAQDAEQKTAATLKKEIEMEHLQGEIGKNWPRVLEHMSPPSLRRSLAEGRISEKEDGILTITFSARFHMEKANLIENRAKIEKAIEHLFTKKIKVVCVLDTSAGNRPSPPAAPTKKTAPTKSAAEDLAKTALEIFGSDEF